MSGRQPGGRCVRQLGGAAGCAAPAYLYCENVSQVVAVCGSLAAQLGAQLRLRLLLDGGQAPLVVQLQLALLALQLNIHL